MNAQEFKLCILQQFYSDIHHVETDNFAHERFDFDGVDHSHEFDRGQHAHSLDWFVSNANVIFQAWSRLADAASRDLYIDLLRFRLSGHHHVKIRSKIPLLKDAAAKFRSLFPGDQSPLQAPGLFGDLRHFEIDWANHHYSVDTYKGGLVFGLIYQQYYFSRGDLRIQPDPGDYVVDGGACTGDSSVLFSTSVGSQGRVYSFDPVQNHIDICKHNFSRPEYNNITLFECGLSDRAVDAEPIRLEKSHPGFNIISAEAVPLRTIDELVQEGAIKKVDFIKMDIEGSEMAALAGARETLHAQRPKLAISLYHRPNDLFEIINFLHDEELEYQLYLDHYTIHNEETILYAHA